MRIGARVSSTHPTGQRACRRPANFIVGGQEAVTIADRINQRRHHDWIEAFLVSHREVRLADQHQAGHQAG
ncbi:hypothetical protein [Synechococcus sp. CBW1004]|uniref:hypothetical protein n=1 Tax=Synechococcus sp. CBW1004 TaxID=1353136 RepID=UPI001E5452BC|nr:hypothetical protein [Synechococcus sp. CBW1004]